MPAPPDAVLAGPFAGVLLDMDGTLIDSIAAVERSWLRWSAEFGVDPTGLQAFHGVPAQRVVAEVVPDAARHAEAFRRIREIEVADTAGIVVLPGAAELLRTLADGGVPTAIVTSSTTDLAEARLAATGLRHPEVVVTASDVERGKPHPDPWLLGARRLGVDPRECLVVEDAVAGLLGARAAGCAALVGVTGTTSAEALGGVADVVVPALTALAVRAAGGLARVAVAA